VICLIIAGKLFHTCGPTTAKLLSPCVEQRVFCRKTNGDDGPRPSPGSRSRSRRRSTCRRKQTQKSTISRVLNKLPETGILASEDTRILFLFHYTIGQRIAPGAARRYAPRRWQFNPKIAANLRRSADWSAVPTSLVAGGG